MRRLPSALASATALAAVLLVSSSARAQQPPPPLPPPPPPPPGSQPEYAPPPPQQQPQYTYPQQQPQYAPQPQRRAQPAPPPPPVDYEEPEQPVHTPRFSLYTGARLNFTGWAGGFFQNELGERETTGNFAGVGPSFQLDVGARIARRYIPFLFFEQSFYRQGHRFDGSDASSSGQFYGLGFRFASVGEYSDVGFMSELAVGVRSVRVSEGNQSYTMSGLEFFRLGLGAEIRLATLFSISPMATIAAGSFQDAEGTIGYSAEGSGDGLTQPTFQNRTIRDGATYVHLGVGIGGHFDIFGK